MWIKPPDGYMTLFCFRHKICLTLRIAVLTGIMVALSASCVSRPRTSDVGFYVKARQGETIKDLAQRYGVKTDELASINHVGPRKTLKSGQSIFVPAIHNAIVSQQKPKVSRELARVNVPYIDWPVAGSVSSYYGRRFGRMHKGIDIKAGVGAGIKAAAEGKVIFAGWMRGYGRTLIMDHGGYTTLYAHCSRLLARRGQTYRKGQLIATVGQTGNATGPHLHFEYRTAQGLALNPIPFIMDRKTLLSSR